jgi:hypothetical protein
MDEDPGIRVACLVNQGKGTVGIHRIGPVLDIPMAACPFTVRLWFVVPPLRCACLELPHPLATCHHGPLLRIRVSVSGGQRMSPLHCVVRHGAMAQECSVSGAPKG